jgi:aquaporin Z
MRDALRRHAAEYLMEAALLGGFMISAGLFGCLLFHPASPAGRLLPDGIGRRVVMGLAMGATAFGLIHSTWGRRSGAHMNPAVTLAFWRLGKLEAADALFYISFQFAGAVAGLALLGLLLAGPLAHPSVQWVVTKPGAAGTGVAFAAEAAISFVLMLTVLIASNTPSLARHTALLAASLLAVWIALESPLSGMSMNPARTFGSAARANVWEAFWIYLTAPPLAMLAAAEAYARARGSARVHCAKLHHDNRQRCIFRCGQAMPAGASPGRNA